MARLMQITETWYQKLESGAASWSEQQVAQFARSLDLSAEDRFVLYRLALGWTAESVRALSGVSEANKTATDSFAVPALLLDHIYTVRYRNGAMAELIPELTPGANWMTWILAAPLARKRLTAWERDWATPTLAQLRTAYALAEPHLKPELEVLIDVVRLASPDLTDRLWYQAAYYVTPAGERRRVSVGDPVDSRCGGHSLLPPAVIAREIVEDLQAALDEFAVIADPWVSRHWMNQRQRRPCQRRAPGKGSSVRDRG